MEVVVKAAAARGALVRPDGRISVSRRPTESIGMCPLAATLDGGAEAEARCGGGGVQCADDEAVVGGREAMGRDS